MTGVCRACRSTALAVVLDLGTVPAADFFPSATSDPRTDDCGHPLAMALCEDCGLAQLLDDDTVIDEPRGVEPEALRRDAATAIDAVARRGWLTPGTVVREFGSPHGGSWIPAITARGTLDARPADSGSDTDGSADLIVDGFGLMHEPDQRAALAERARLLSGTGILVLQVHSFATIVEKRQWTALRHGHFAYWSLTALENALAAASLVPMGCLTSTLYGGTLHVLARRADAAPAYSPLTDVDLDTAAAVRADEALLDLVDPESVAVLGQAAVADVAALRRALEKSEGQHTAAYGAASRAVALFAMAGVTRKSIAAVVDASPAKWGRRMPGTDVPIVGPDWMYERRPDRILVTVPDLLAEVSQAHPEMPFADFGSLSEGVRR